jgi:hypothetical protein
VRIVTANLSTGAQLRVRALFAPGEQAEAERVLVQGCDPNLLSIGHTNTAELNRIWFAVLKLSEGNLGKLREAVALAQRDYRDVLLWSGFGDDVHAHEAWTP